MLRLFVVCALKSYGSLFVRSRLRMDAVAAKLRLDANWEAATVYEGRAVAYGHAGKASAPGQAA